MPNHGKGGRKPEGTEAKRAAVAVRTTPALKARLEASATEAGRSVTQEIEARLEASLDFKWDGLDVKTQELFVEIARDIRRAEALTGKRWHKDLRTWAMAREALATGEIDRQCPPLDRLLSDGDDSHVSELWQRLSSYRGQLRSLALAVMELGYPIPFNSLSFVDVTEPVFQYEEHWDYQIAHGFDPGPHKDAILSLMRKMKEIEAERKPVAQEYRDQHALIIEAIDNAVAEWKSDREAKGIFATPEYRPAPEFRPVRVPETTGAWLHAGDDAHVTNQVQRLKDKKGAARVSRDA